jgi:hypothetical protein
MKKLQKKLFLGIYTGRKPHIFYALKNFAKNFWLHFVPGTSFKKTKKLRKYHVPNTGSSGVHNSLLVLNRKNATVKIMILSRYRYRPVTIPLPFLGLRYRPLPFFVQRYVPLPYRRLAPKVIFLRKSQVKSPKSQVMTLTFSKGLFENTFRRFL